MGADREWGGGSAPYSVLGASSSRQRAVVSSDQPQPAPAGLESAAHRRRLASSAFVFALATGLSRLLGLVREIVARNYFGVEGKINAFTVAFQVPNLIRALIADVAFTSAFVPVFSELLVKGERRRAWAVASSLFWLLLLGLGGLVALGILLAPLVVAPFGVPVGAGDLAVGLTRVLFPIVVLLGISGVFVGLLNSYDRFSAPALSPVAWNLVIIVGLVLGVPRADSEDGKLYVYAASVLVGTVVQVLLPLPWLRGLDGHLRVAVDWRDPAVRRVFVLMLPVTISLGLINFNAVVDTLFASRLLDPNLAPAAIDAAFRLYMLPQGLFSVAVATVLFPSLSRAAAAGDLVAFRHWVGVGLRQMAFLLLPAGAACAVLADPIVRLVYERGAFTPRQTEVVAEALAAFSLGLAFNGAMLMLNRAFFSLQSPWLPTGVALANLGLNAVLDAAFYPLGVWGIPLATSVVNIVGALALIELLRRRVGDVEAAETGRSALLILLASGALAVVARSAWQGLDAALGRSLGAQLTAVALALAAGALSYLVGCLLLGVRETRPLLALLGGRRS
ncbi:MAG: murein biosynthesis integral membrane protein MurJ [Thermoleophilia bacterium]